MGREDQIIQERQKKLDELKKAGINPYPTRFNVKNKAQELQDKYSKLKNEEHTKDSVKIAGRLITFRDLGKISFGVIQDVTGKIQIVLQDGETPDKIFEFFKKYIDTGDFIGIEGSVFRTKRGELSVLLKKAELLTKSMLPLPEKYHGLQDEEERYRKRYLDMLSNPDVKKIFETRMKILDVMRAFMKKHNFAEVETPLLQSVYGGANAKPFITHCDAFNSDVFLSIAPELYLKKALVGGFDRVYEITKKFRNEGVDRSHNPEHMTLEWYQAYANYEDGMDLFEELMKDICMALNGSLTFEFQGNKINLAKWRRLPLAEAIKEYLKEDISKIKTDSQAKAIAKKHKIPEDGVTKANIADELMKLFRDKLIQPTFLTDYPIELSPLAKPKATDTTKAEVFQPFIGGLEIARAYSELNDPKLQAENFKAQEDDRASGNKEAMPTDTDFVTALSHGMPPACGLGLGIERVVMLFTNQTSIRDVIMFPFMKPLGFKESQEGKAQESKLAVAIVNKSADLEPWQYLNTVAHLNAAFGARAGKALLSQDKIKTKDNSHINLNIQHAIMLKEAINSKEIQKVLDEAKKLGLEIAEFTREMLVATDDKKIIDITKDKNLKDIEHLGVLVFGKKSLVEKLTSDFKLFSNLKNENLKKEVKSKKHG
jgi:lysyl-tRNA synthetase class 2